jgi:hypothetical protein
MSKAEKLLKRFLSMPKDFTFEELRALLGSLGYREVRRGHTSGSRVAFYREASGHIIKLHRPHPRPVLKEYQVEELITSLKNAGVIS